MEIQNSKSKNKQSLRAKALQKYKSKFKNFLTFNFLIALLTFNFYLLTLPIYALEPTQIATPSSNLKLKLKALQDGIASRAAQLKTEVGNKLQNKAYVGFVKSQSTEAITLATNKGTKLINVNEYTEYVNQTKTTGTKSKAVKGVAVDEFIVALGDVDETSVLTAKKIVRLTSPKETGKKTIFGDVISIEGDTVTISTRQNQNITVSIGKNTTLETNKGQELSFEDIKLNRPIIVAGTSPKEGVIDAEFVYILPYTANFKPKVATSSAKVVTTLSDGEQQSNQSRSASPSAKPSPSGVKSKTKVSGD